MTEGNAGPTIRQVRVHVLEPRSAGWAALDLAGGVKLPFTKVEGLGNDFLLLDVRGEPRPLALALLPRLAEVAPRICDRRRGVGGDGLLVVGPPASADAEATMWVINYDGSRPEMCGNGLRCVAHFVARSLGTDDATRSLDIDTDAGRKPCRVVLGGERGEQAEVEVDMGPGRDLGTPDVAAGVGFSWRAVSMGNPHAITFVADDPEMLARTLGPGIEIDPAFPDRTNVEFAHVRTERGSAAPHIVLWVWERGCGITEACGTGACATACAAVWSGLAPADTPIVVELPGGPLRITVPSDPQAGVRMRGPSRLVFTGEIEIAGRT